MVDWYPEPIFASEIPQRTDPWAAAVEANRLVEEAEREKLFHAYFPDVTY